MRKLILLVPALLLSFAPLAGHAGTVYGADRRDVAELPLQWFYKLGRGCKNLVYAPLEVPFHALNEANQALHRDRNPLVGAFAGTVVGVGFMFARAATGAVEVATFPVTFAAEPFMTPETPMELTFGID